MSIEKLKTGIDLQAIAEAYGYKPYADDYEMPNKVDLGIDWTALSLELGDIIEKVDLKTPNAFFDFSTYFKDLKLEINSNVSSKENKAYLNIRLANINDQGISILEIERSDNICWLEHRITTPLYRHQGIGSQLLTLAETIIQNKLNRSHWKEIKIAAEVGQPKLWKWLLNRGFKIRKDEKEKFETTLLELEAGDPKFAIQDISNSQNADWYIFLTKDTECRTLSYSNSVRFTFEKIITPDLTQETNQAINSCLDPESSSG